MTAPLPSAPLPTVPRKLQPGVTGYVVGAVLLVASVVAVIGFFVWGVVDEANWVPSVPPIVDSEAEVVLEADTNYTIYAESFGGYLYLDEQMPWIVDPDGNSILPASVYDDLDVEYNGRTYLPIYEFTTRSGGTYLIVRGTDEELPTMLLGPAFGDALWSKVLWGFLVATILGLIGVGLLIATGVRRSRDRGQRDRDVYGPGPSLYSPASNPYGPYGYPGTPPPEPQPSPPAPPPPSGHDTAGPSPYPGVPPSAGPQQTPPPSPWL